MLLTISMMSIARGILGMGVLIGIAYAFSENRKAINWKLVAKGLGAQIVFAVGILYVDFINQGFDKVSSGFQKVIGFSKIGADFLYASFLDGTVSPLFANFIFGVLPTIIFFSALTSLLYYLGVLQKIVWVFAFVMKKLMNLSGAESMAAAGNVFLGQTETPLLIKPFLATMTRSEVMCLMTGGMATIAGGVLAAYMQFLGGGDAAVEAEFARHLLAASIMSAPAAIVAAKILVPETDEINTELVVTKEKVGSNWLEAISNGTSDGIKLAVNVAGMLLVFIALMGMANYILDDLIGEWTGISAWVRDNTQYEGFTFQMILGYVCAPLAWLMGVCSEDMVLVGQLLGEKTILNEFVAYLSLGELKAAGAFKEEKSIVMATYVLCGFANFASIGIQIGGIGALIPSRKGLLSKLGVKALIAGTIACMFTAVVVGMVW